jgi:hypothetical protein
MPGNRPRERNSQLAVPKANKLNTAQRGLWVYTGGNVRQVYRRAFDLDEGNHHIRARIVEGTSPVNPGDGGGPVLNDEGELVAIVDAVSPKAYSCSLFIDIREILALLEYNRCQAGALLTQPNRPACPVGIAARLGGQFGV